MQSFKMCWGAAVTPEFRHGVIEMCVSTKGWGVDHVNWMMGCIAQETGSTFSPSVKNKAGSGATGLIQFMEKTAIGLGTTTQQLERMTAVQQLRYVKDYFKPYAPKIKSLSDMYMAILLPKYVGADDSTVLFSDGVSYRQNSGLDANHDKKVTKLEACERVLKVYDKGLTMTAEEIWPL